MTCMLLLMLLNSLVLLIVRGLSVLISKHLSTGSRHALAVLPGFRGLPLCGLARHADLVVELIDLFEGETLGLVDEEVDKGDADEAAAEPDEEDLALEVGLAGTKVDEVGS